MEAKAAIFRRPHEALTFESIELDDPAPREVLVRIVASGVCHSDLHFVDGGIPWRSPDPMVLGHEGAGVILAAGDQVTTVSPGDHVVGCLSGFCGTCEQCHSGHPNRCVDRVVGRGASAPPRISQDGTPVAQFANLGAFADHMLVHENSIVRIDGDIPLDRAALVGCGVLTGVGTALRTARVEPGQTVAVLGCGGVGLSIVQGARIAGASRIIAVDMFDSKLEMATAMGATHAVNSGSEGGEDAVAAIREAAGGSGVDHAFEAVGLPDLVRQAVKSLAIGGTATVVGVLPPGSTIAFPWEALRPECRVQTSRMGSNRFRIDIPRYLEFYRDGRLLLDEMVSRRGPLEDVNDAFRAMKEGEVARTVLMFE